MSWTAETDLAIRRAVIEDSGVLEFQNGIPAFERARRFSIVAGAAPLVFLQSADEREIRLPMVDYKAALFEYELSLSEEDCRSLEVSEQCTAEAVEVYFVLSLHEGQLTVNLLAPVVVCLNSRRGVQAIRGDRRYSAVHPIAFASEAGTRCWY